MVVLAVAESLNIKPSDEFGAASSLFVVRLRCPLLILSSSSSVLTEEVDGGGGCRTEREFSQPY